MVSTSPASITMSMSRVMRGSAYTFIAVEPLNMYGIRAASSRSATRKRTSSSSLIEAGPSTTDANRADSRRTPCRPRKQAHAAGRVGRSWLAPHKRHVTCCRSMDLRRQPIYRA
jgi:hypothetical protein